MCTQRFTLGLNSIVVYILCILCVCFLNIFCIQITGWATSQPRICRGGGGPTPACRLAFRTVRPTDLLQSFSHITQALPSGTRDRIFHHFHPGSQQRRHRTVLSWENRHERCPRFSIKSSSANVVFLTDNIRSHPDALGGVAALDPAGAAGRVEGVDRRHLLDRRDTGPRVERGGATPALQNNQSTLMLQ